MIFNPAEIVEYISSIMTLEKGDLIFTGTPAGVSKVKRGDKLEARLGEIAELVCDCCLKRGHEFVRAGQVQRIRGKLFIQFLQRFFNQFF